GSFRFRLHSLLANLFALTQNPLLFGIHLQPAFGVSPHRFAILRRKLIVAIARRIQHAVAGTERRTLRVEVSWLPLSERLTGSKNGRNRGGSYNDGLSSHKLFSSEASSS